VLSKESTSRGVFDKKERKKRKKVKRRNENRYRYSLITMNLFGRAFILLWTTFLPSNLGFHLPRQAHEIITHRSQFLTTSLTQRSIRNVQLEAFWKFSSSSSPSNGDSDEDEEITEEEEGEVAKPQDKEEDSSTDIDIKYTSKQPGSSITDSTYRSLLSLINDIGNNFKDMAEKATARGYLSEDQYKKILYAAKACLYYTIFIIYRSYRGFFVLLPITVRQVYKKMNDVMNTENLSMLENNDGATTTVRKSNNWRTKLTVSMLTSVVTISYIFGGALEMITKFFQTITKTSNVTKSFEAAADEMVNFEGRISRVGKINGEENIEPLTP